MDRSGDPAIFNEMELFLEERNQHRASVADQQQRQQAAAAPASMLQVPGEPESRLEYSPLNMSTIHSELQPVDNSNNATFSAPEEGAYDWNEGFGPVDALLAEAAQQKGQEQAEMGQSYSQQKHLQGRAVNYQQQQPLAGEGNVLPGFQQQNEQQHAQNETSDDDDLQDIDDLLESHKQERKSALVQQHQQQVYQQGQTAQSQFQPYQQHVYQQRQIVQDQTRRQFSQPVTRQETFEEHLQREKREDNAALRAKFRADEAAEAARQASRRERQPRTSRLPSSDSRSSSRPRASLRAPYGVRPSTAPRTGQGSKRKYSQEHVQRPKLRQTPSGRMAERDRHNTAPGSSKGGPIDLDPQVSKVRSAPASRQWFPAGYNPDWRPDMTRPVHVSLADIIRAQQSAKQQHGSVPDTPRSRFSKGKEREQQKRSPNKALVNHQTAHNGSSNDHRTAHHLLQGSSSQPRGRYGEFDANAHPYTRAPLAADSRESDRSFYNVEVPSQRQATFQPPSGIFRFQSTPSTHFIPGSSTRAGESTVEQFRPSQNHPALNLLDRRNPPISDPTFATQTQQNVDPFSNSSTQCRSVQPGLPQSASNLQFTPVPEVAQSRIIHQNDLPATLTGPEPQTTASMSGSNFPPVVDDNGQIMFDGSVFEDNGGLIGGPENDNGAANVSNEYGRVVGDIDDMVWGNDSGAGTGGFTEPAGDMSQQGQLGGANVQSNLGHGIVASQAVDTSAQQHGQASGFNTVPSSNDQWGVNPVQVSTTSMPAVTYAPLSQLQNMATPGSATSINPAERARARAQQNIETFSAERGVVPPQKQQRPVLYPQYPSQHGYAATVAAQVLHSSTQQPHVPQPRGQIPTSQGSAMQAGPSQAQQGQPQSAAMSRRLALMEQMERAQRELAEIEAAQRQEELLQSSGEVFQTQTGQPEVAREMMFADFPEGQAVIQDPVPLATIDPNQQDPNHTTPVPALRRSPAIRQTFQLTREDTAQLGGNNRSSAVPRSRVSASSPPRGTSRAAGHSHSPEGRGSGGPHRAGNRAGNNNLPLHNFDAGMRMPGGQSSSQTHTFTSAPSQQHPTQSFMIAPPVGLAAGQPQSSNSASSSQWPGRNSAQRTLMPAPSPVYAPQGSNLLSHNSPQHQPLSSPKREYSNSPYPNTCACCINGKQSELCRQGSKWSYTYLAAGRAPFPEPASIARGRQYVPDGEGGHFDLMTLGMGLDVDWSTVEELELLLGLTRDNQSH